MRILLSLFCIFLCCLTHARLIAQANFAAPDTVCVDAPVAITNTSVGGASFFWNFCSGGLYNPPQITNLGNIGGQMSLPVFLVTAKDGDNYYAFYTNNTGNLVRLTFGNNLLNTPATEDLGTFSGLLTNTTEGLQLVRDADGWHLVVVGGNNTSTARILRLDFGSSLSNPVSGTKDWGNIGMLEYPVDLYITQENNNWYGFTVNYYNNTVTRFDFGTSFSNNPVAVNLGNIGNLNNPTGIFAMKENGNWHVFVTNEGSGTITRMDLGNSLSNTPTAVNLGNPSGVLNQPRDLCLIHDCGNIFGLVVNRGNNSMDRIDFKDGITSVAPDGLTGVVLNTDGNLSFPHSISTIFREGNSLYAFVTNAYNNTLSRLVFSNCDNASIPSSNALQPPVFSYNQPGSYTVNLLMDEFGLNESAFCRNIVVLPKPVPDLGNDRIICDGSSVDLDAGEGFTSYKWNNNATTQKVTADQSGIYEVEVSNGGCSVKDQVQVDVEMITLDNITTDIDCNHASGQITLNATGGVEPYLFYIDGALHSNGNVFDQLSAGTYTFKVTDEKGCTATSDLPIKIEESRLLKTAAVTTPPNCSGMENGRIDISVDKGVPPFEYAIKGQPFQLQPAFENLAPGSYTVYTRNGFCLDSLYLELNAPEVMELQLTKEDDICSRNMGKVLINVTGGEAPYTYYWDNSLVSSPIIEKLGVGAYNLKVNDVNGCNVDTAITLVNNDIPPVTILNTDITINIGEMLSLTATNAPDYLWTPAESLSCADCATPTARPLESTTYIVTTVTGQNCIKSDTLHVYVSHSQSLFVPNAFTPNSDGANEVFRAKVKGVAKYRLAIFNRWGELLFETNDPLSGWNGRYKNMLQPIGAYVYLIEYTYLGKEEKVLAQKGTFMLLK